MTLSISKDVEDLQASPACPSVSQTGRWSSCTLPGAEPRGLIPSLCQPGPEPLSQPSSLCAEPCFALLPGVLAMMTIKVSQRGDVSHTPAQPILAAAPARHTLERIKSCGPRGARGRSGLGTCSRCARRAGCALRHGAPTGAAALTDCVQIQVLFVWYEY